MQLLLIVIWVIVLGCLWQLTHYVIDLIELVQVLLVRVGLGLSPYGVPSFLLVLV